MNRYINSKTAVIILIILFTFTGCTKPQIFWGKKTNSQNVNTKREPVRLRIAWWGLEPRHIATNKILDMYISKNPDVEFEREFMSYDGYYSILMAQAATNNLPDIFQCSLEASTIVGFAEKNLLADLDIFIKDRVLDISDVETSIIEQGRYKDKTLALPLGFGAWGLAVDPAMFQKAGVKIPSLDYDWKDFEKILYQLHQKNDLYGINSMECSWFFDIWYARSLGQRTFSKSGKGLGFEPATLESFFKTVLKYQEDGIVPPLQEIRRIKDIKDSFLIKGEAAMEVIPTGHYPNYVAAAGRSLKLIPLPNSFKYKDAMKVGAGLQMAISNACIHKKEAAEFMDYITNDIEANKLLQGERGVPISKKVRDALKNQLTPEHKEVYEYIDLIHKSSIQSIDTVPSEGTKVIQLFRDVTEQILFKRITPEKGTRVFVEEANNILDR